jgi:hypothetical protein
MSSLLASVCPVLDDGTTFLTQEHQHESNHYEPTSVVSFLSHRLPSLSYSTRYRNDYDGSSNVTFTSPIVHDWMQQNDRTSYAISVISTWVLVTIFLVVGFCLVWLVPKCGQYYRHRRNGGKPIVQESPSKIVVEQQTHRDFPSPHFSSPSKATAPPLSISRIVRIHRDIVSSSTDDSLEYYSAEEYTGSDLSSEQPLGITPFPQQHQQRLQQHCFVVEHDHDDIPLQHLPPTSIPAELPSPYHQQMHDVSDLTGVTFHEDELNFISKPSTAQEDSHESTAQVDQQFLTASQYLSYCNRQSPKLTATSSCEDSVSIDLLGVSIISSSNTSHNRLNTDYDASASGNQNVDGHFAADDNDFDVPTQQDTTSIVRDDRSRHSTKSKSTTTIIHSQHTEHLKDVLRNVYLEDVVTDEEMPFADSEEEDDDSSSNPVATTTTIKNFSSHHHLLLSPSIIATAEHELSTIAPASLDTSFSPQIMEEGFLFFQDDDDDENSVSQTQGNAVTLNSPNKKRTFFLPPTLSLTVKGYDASSPHKGKNVAVDTSKLKHSHYYSDAASRKRQLEQYVIAIKSTNNDDNGEGLNTSKGDGRNNVVKPSNGNASFDMPLQPFPPTTKLVTPAADDPAQQEYSGTPDTSPTSTNGAAREDILFQDEDDENDHSGDVTRSNPALAKEPSQEDVDDECRRRLPFQRKPNSNGGSWTRPSKKHVNFASSSSKAVATKSISRPTDSFPNTTSWCCRDSWILSILALFACTSLIVATILFAMNGVWTIQLLAKDAEFYWGDLMEKAVGQLPGAMQRLQQAQTAVLQRKYANWHKRTRNER